ncbi:Zinc/iron permease [Delphinella strobiligena]|nr:Zinc/iron permease [Delphinella strobiligena]
MQDAVARDLSTSWADIPTSLLRAELSRRQEDVDLERPACGTRGAKQEYNTPLHVFALFLILILSTIACSFPILVRRVPQLTIPHRFLFLSRHFGTGVLIATAFVHLLPTAFNSLTDQCLPPFWTQGYPAMPGFIAMVSVMVVVGVEMFFAAKGAGHSHNSEYTSGEDGHTQSKQGHAPKGQSRPKHGRTESLRRFRQGRIGLEGSTSEDTVLEDASHWLGAPNANGDSQTLSPTNKHIAGAQFEDSDLDLDELDPQSDTTHFLTQHERRTSEEAYKGNEDEDDHIHHHLSTSKLSEHQQQQKMLLQCMLLEAGILFHSIFIGMAVSVATGTSFIVLLVAISFHQTFEGLALGSRIAAITFPPQSPKPWLMALAYGTTTPLGQAIGLLIHNLYDPYGQTGLLMVGITNAVSSGLLLFAGLVELLAEDFLSDHSYETLRGQMRLQACASVLAGAFLMALVGAWA